VIDNDEGWEARGTARAAAHTVAAQPDGGTTVSSIEIVVAVDEAGVIGNAGTLPWHHPADLRRFRNLTGHCPVIVGRTTMDDIVRRAAGRPILPTRTPIVISRNATPWPTAPTVAAAIAVAEEYAAGQIFVIGGARVYTEALPLATDIHVTVMPGVHDGDVRMPDGWLDGWVETEREHGPDGLQFVTYARPKRPAPERFCYCGGMASTTAHVVQCRERAEQVIGGPLREQIAQLARAVERAQARVAELEAEPRALAEFDADRDRYREHSQLLNTIGYRMAEALDLTRDGQPVNVDLAALVERILDDRAGYRARAESAEDQLVKGDEVTQP
jgi:dihydrofolate reductase